MRGVLSREQARDYDRFATEQANVPSLLLMENAGRGATERLLALRRGALGRVVVLAGPGNNGGDGFVLARRLLVLGHTVEVWLVGAPSRLAGDAAVMWHAYRGVGGRENLIATEADLSSLGEALAGATIIVDALFGTGLARPVDGLYARVIELAQRTEAYVLALDIPSGLDANSGRILGTALRADATVTFGCEKLGHFTSDGVDCSGQLELVDIGVPRDLYLHTGHAAERILGEDLAPRFVLRSAASHKGRAGRVAILGGHVGTTGAALLAARGALRMGAGLVTHVGLPETISAIESRVLEAMTKRLEPAALEPSLTDALRATDCVVLGPGLGLGPEQRRIVAFVAEQAAVPVVVDADALTILADDPSVLEHKRGPRILLPHRGELARLLRTTIAAVEQDPFAALARAVDATQAIVVLKGAYSFVGAPNQKPYIVGAPCPALGTAGSGDVLSGIVAALLVDHEPYIAALLGVHLHSRAGMLWADARSVDRGMVASDIADNLPAAIAELSRAKRPVTV
jgi:ADP-dependent NAD(P)H-hydrate dehydratase / NAD(P)H-hydrate epimerase